MDTFRESLEELSAPEPEMAAVEASETCNPIADCSGARNGTFLTRWNGLKIVTLGATYLCSPKGRNR